MIDPISAVIYIFLIFCGGAMIWLLVRPRIRAIVEYENHDLPEANFSYRLYEDDGTFNRTELSVGGQGDHWRQRMGACGRKMKAHRVRAIFFVHGTFAGDDPWGIINSLKVAYPSISKSTATQIAATVKSNADSLMKDNGNYTADYISLYQEAINNNIEVKAFHWSSENHHVARLKGAISLARTLAKHIRSANLDLDDRILLQGHSHAGQVFALLTQLLEENDLGSSLLTCIRNGKLDKGNLAKDLATIRQVYLEFVTYGTPPLYHWPDAGYFRLLNIINHRGATHFADDLTGLLTTRGGDYIQQLAIQGTDLIAASSHDRRLNKELDQILGKGRDLETWRQGIKKRMRIPPLGKTYLVNYQDDSDLAPNFIKTFFGHGVYTKYDTMLFNTELLTHYFYQYK